VSAVQVEAVSRRFGECVAVDGVSFGVEHGEVVAVLGPNGAGKTTIIEMLEGYLAPSSGTISVLGVDPRRGDRRWRARIGLVLQSTSLDQCLSVREALAVFAALFPAPHSVGEVLELIDLEADADTRIGQLSGGQQRRVDLGLGIVGRPDLLFLDEPTTGLDPAARHRTWDAIAQLAADGTTVLLSTHYMEEAQHLADRLLVLNGGRLVADATPDELRRRALRSSVRLPLVSGAPTSDLPHELALHVEQRRGELLMRTSDITYALQQLIEWANAHDVDLSRLEVGAPDLEDAYLTLTSPTSEEEPVNV
jgi:ABC-2 type transport system ATP-binding protein